MNKTSLFPAPDPAARPTAMLRAGSCRFTVLSPWLIRCEYAEDGIFEDRPSLSVCNRRFPKTPFTTTQTKRGIRIETTQVTLECGDCGKAFSRQTLSARFPAGDRRGVWRFGDDPAGNLGGTPCTLDACDGDCHIKRPQMVADPNKRVDIGQGLCSRDGWAVVDDSPSLLLDPSAGLGESWPCPRPAGTRQDLYLFLHGLEYEAALRDGARLLGPQPLPPRWAFGYWYCRYWAYTDIELEELVNEHDRYDLPLDVLVVDMDWHQLGWTGYTWSREFFPDHRELLQHLRGRGLKISLNLHPADGVSPEEERHRDFIRIMGESRARERAGADGRIPFDCADPHYMKAYFEALHHPLEDEGVDFWWMDWQQGTQCAIPGLDPHTWINALHWRDLARRHPEKRPLVFTRYGGLGSGRQPIGFSGDTMSTWRSLAFQPRMTAQAANVLFGHWSHDIGGHMLKPPSPELLTRWMQWGVYAPILRAHSTKEPANDRRVYNLPEPFRGIMVRTLRRRYELVPMIASEWRKALPEGRSLLRPMYHVHPECEEAYHCPQQFYFGSHMLVAPVVTPARAADGLARISVWLPEGEWIETATGKRYSGGKHTLDMLLEETPVFVRPGTVIVGQWNAKRLPAGPFRHLLLDLWAGGDGEEIFYEDDGESTGFMHGREVTLRVRHRERKHRRSLTLHRAKGDFDGFLRHRPLRLQVHLTPPPLEVRVGGTLFPWSLRPQPGCWSYDGDLALLTVDVPRIDHREDTRIDITCAKDAPDIPDAWPGALRRLRQAQSLCAEVSFYKVMHPRERLCASVSQTGNRIRRRPETLREELGAFAADLRGLPRVLREYRDRLAAHPDIHDRAPTVDRARKLVNAARRLLKP
ncbi:MAG: DUF5110 domain-containing protein [Verrucomicrobia bacterium]|nr:DUF5110 domain-containing protein [Verrucomicrobiota bacterium]MCH8513104.1 glycoside hydrolase family 31 protein [Kiritimatiellia bacterium]